MSGEGGGEDARTPTDHIQHQSVSGEANDERQQVGDDRHDLHDVEVGGVEPGDDGRMERPVPLVRITIGSVRDCTRSNGRLTFLPSDSYMRINYHLWSSRKVMLMSVPV